MEERDIYGSKSAETTQGYNEHSTERETPITKALSLVESDMARYAEALVRALEPQQPYITEAEMEIYRRGKKLRPLLLILSARMVYAQGDETPLPIKAINAAVSTEMLHVATLIHDDIIDHAPMRRGIPSVNEERGTEVAILMGDMQFVQAIRCFTDSIDTESDMGLVRLVLNTAFKICCGEMDELQTDPNWDTATLRGRYFQTIERKTAVLFGLACECGVALGGGRTRDARRIGFFGRRLGRAFQIMDDIFDIARSLDHTGKLPGTDLARRRLSLPIIYAMAELGADHLVSAIVKGAEYSQNDLLQALLAVRKSDGFVQAYQDARMQALDSLQYLDPFPENNYKQALQDIIFYVVNREYKTE